MKILMVNSFHYPRGGAERVYLDLSTLLESHGHQVIHFSSVHEKNLPSEYAKYFVSPIDLPSHLGKKNSLKSQLQVAERVIYSREARRKIERLIEDTKPDIAHLHGIAHYLSPSILPGIKKSRIPVVMTLHDYKLLCPNTHFLSKGEVCERCKVHRYYNVILHTCKRDSIPASLIAGVELYIHKILQIYEKNIDLFIVPSNFLGEKLKEYGVRNRIAHVPNFVDTTRFSPVFESEPYGLYFGRISKEKGLATLLDAVGSAASKASEMTNPPTETLKLHIAGTGPEEARLKMIAADRALSNIIFHGHLSQEKLIPLIQHARFTLLPSEWYENYPLAVIESFACGTPVIASDIGAIPDIVADGHNGLLFSPGNSKQLRERMTSLFNDSTRAAELGRNGRDQVERANGSKVHLKKIVDLYQSLLQSEKPE